MTICIPVFNAEAWIRRAVDSALAQTHTDLEVVVTDNASTDATLQRVREIDEPRVRLYSNSTNLGVYGNFNRALSLARGRYLQVLCADDALYPDSVEAMVSVFESDRRVGLVFSPRDIELENPRDPVASRWKAKHADTHLRFGQLGQVNDGEALLRAWIRDQFATNWIGEPSNVMLSRECLEQVGTFPVHMYDRGDMDLWARAMLSHSIGFVDRPLTMYLVRAGSLAAVNRETDQAWLDMLWLIESLLTFDGVRTRYPAIPRHRRRLMARILGNLVRGTRAPETGKMSDVRRYLGYRLRGGGDRSRLFGTLRDRGPAGETVAVPSPTAATVQLI